MSIPIASVEDGTRACVAGTVRRARGALLASALSKKPCVYWDVRRGLLLEPTSREAQDFWIEDASGRALIVVDAIAVEARGHRQQEVLRVAETDYAAVSARIRELKDRLKTTYGPEASKLRREQQALGRIATLLCAIRAHARGRVHLGGDLAGQERWIHANAEKSDDRAAVKLMIESWEVVIEEGQRVEVEGVCSIEPIPHGVGASGGYRDRPTCLVVRAPDGGAVRVTGVGTLAPQSPSELRVASPSIPRPDGRSRQKFERAVIAVLALVLSAAALLTWLSE